MRELQNRYFKRIRGVGSFSRVMQSTWGGFSTLRARCLKLNINIRDMRVMNCARATRSAGVLGVVENPGSGTVLEESEWTISTGRVSIYTIGVLGGR